MNKWDGEEEGRERTGEGREGRRDKEGSGYQINCNHWHLGQIEGKQSQRYNTSIKKENKTKIKIRVKCNGRKNKRYKMERIPNTK